MKRAFTLIELLVVVLILGLLASIAVGVFTNQVERARYAAAKATISSMELAINRYQIDLGQFPPSGTNNLSQARTTPANGCGLLELCLIHSTSGSAQNPSDKRWQGPYLTVKNEQLGTINGVPLNDPSITTPVLPGEVQILDPWQQPYRYVRSRGVDVNDLDNYDFMVATKLPATNPFFATETWYNSSTFQISSKGNNGTTLTPPDFGKDTDDVTNFGH